MGQSTDAMLVYGYHLDGSDEWAVEGTGEYGELPALDWYDPDDETGFQEAAEARLLASVGFTEEWVPGAGANGYFDRKGAAEEAIGVKFETHCSGDYPMYLLIAKGVTARRGYVEPIDFAALTAEVQQQDADAKLRTALDVLGLNPTQERAQWLLCSYWG